MNSNHFVTVLRYARRLAEHSQAPGLSDRQLLLRHILRSDEHAFTAIVARYGDLVWGVCRRVLHDPNDADDAFQATFLVLLNRAATLRGRASLASWLQGAAWRVARKVRVQAAYRRTKESRPVTAPTADFQEGIQRRELRSVLDKEIARLPSKYRDPLILCYLQGKTYLEAARHLGWTEGTVSGRLARARTMLRHRLAQRGIAVVATTFAGLGIEEAAPAASIRAVERMARLHLVGQVARFSSPVVARLAHSLIAARALGKFNGMVAGILAACVCAVGIGGTALWMMRPGPVEPQPDSPPFAQAEFGSIPDVASTAPKDFYGDPLPAGALARIGSVQLRHPQAQIVFSPDGRSMISARNDMILYWDVASGKLARRLAVPSAFANSGAFLLSRDGKILVTSAKDGSATCVYNASTIQELHRYATEKAYAAGLSADGKILALEIFGEAGSVDIQLLDLTTGKERARLDKVPYQGNCQLSLDGRLLASAEGMGGSVFLWDTESTRKLGKIITGSLDWALSPDGKMVASTDQDGAVTLWDSRSQKQIGILKPAPPVVADCVKPVAFSPDGCYLAVGGEETAVVWDIATRKERVRLPDQHRESLFFSADNKIIASKGASRVRLWDVGTGHEIHKRPGYDGTLNSLAASPDGSRIATIGAGDPFVALWDAATGRPLPPIPISIFWPSLCSFSADGRWLIVSGSHAGLVLLDANTGKVVRQFKNNDQLTGQAAMVIKAHLSRNNKRLAVLNRCWNEQPETSERRVDHQLTVWDVDAGKPIVQRAFDPNAFAAAFSSDEMTVTGIVDKRFKIEEMLTGKERLNLASNFCEPLALSPISFLAAAGVRGRDSKANSDSARPSPAGWPPMAVSGEPLEGIGILELATGEELFRLNCRPTHMAFSADGRVLVTTSPASLQVWDAGTGEELFKLGWPEEPLSKSALLPVTSLALPTGGRTAVTGMYDGTVLVWDLTPAKKPANWALSKNLERIDLESLWADLLGDARTAQSSVNLLAATPEQTLPFLAEQLRPIQAVEAQFLDQLIAKLDSPEFAVRETASRTIARLGEQIEPALRRVLAGKPSRETRKRLETTLAALHGPSTGETRRVARAIQVLARIGTADARQILQKLATGAPDARETKLAKEALAEG